MTRPWTTTALGLLCLCGSMAARAEEPDAETILRQADALLAPPEFEATVTFTTHNSTGAPKSFSIHIWKKGADKNLFKFLSPPDDQGMEVLRVGDDMWNYLPNLKRSVRISPKQDFHGGDFSNSDVLRVNLVEDYTPVLLPSDSPGDYLLELTAKNDQVAYYKVKYWISKKPFMPRRQQFFTQSGKLVRELEFSQPTAFGKLVRPALYVMKNMLFTSRKTEMVWSSLTPTHFGDDRLFQAATLGR